MPFEWTSMDRIHNAHNIFNTGIKTCIYLFIQFREYSNKSGCEFLAKRFYILVGKYGGIRKYFCNYVWVIY